jgi:hypothetical protein
VVLVVEIESVENACPRVINVWLEGLIVTVTLDMDGRLVKAIGPASELMLVNVITEVPAVPCNADTVSGVADIPKLGAVLVQTPLTSVCPAGHTLHVGGLVAPLLHSDGATAENVVQAIENGFTPYPSMPGSTLTRVQGVLGMPHAASALAQYAWTSKLTKS